MQTEAVLASPDEVLGTVRYLDVEGGCWAIVLGDFDDARRIQPIGLPLDFKTDGLKVRVRLEPMPDALSACQIGPLNKVTSIRRE